MRRLWVILLAALAALAVPATPARAQFETINRAFHGGTAFPLQGRHLAVECESCHINKVYRGTPTTCYQCHWLRRQDDRYRTQLGSDCAQCHRTTAWSAVRWDHAAATGMPLNASHRTVGCEGCHKGGDFRAAAVVCASCHQDDYARTQTPNHAAAGFPTTCDTCHRPSDATWRGTSAAGFDHAAVFPLQGQHATTTCASCHRNNIYKGTPRECVACHQANYDRTTNPNHAAAGFPTTCETCHRPADASWRNGGSAGFNHATVFALQGVHATTACASCHRNGVYKGTPRECVACHQANYDRTTSPSHTAAGFPTTCETCHRAADPSWRNGGSAGFNHATVFALQGVHATTACASCHRNGVYKGTPRECVACHQANYDRTTSPSHTAAGFPTTCETCHRAADPSWRNGGSAGFNHATVFALQGVHATTACASCHRNGVYKGTPRECVACHQANYDRTTSPSHTAAGFPTTCETCHRAADPSWRNGGTGGFNHATVFALQGVHARTACASCHRNNVYKGTPRECVACHQANYDRTTSPNHAAAGFPTSCETCHRAADPSWRNGGTGGFNHATVFALQGRHAAAACASCHVNNVYKGTPRECVACHRTLYDRTTSPPHAPAGFPTSCETCHRAADPSWRNGGTGGFNHATVFALQGRHAAAACASCHVNNVYKGTPRECVACHRTLYDRTTSPPHAPAGFPTSCETCHRAADPSWRNGGTGGFNHATVFALQGRHAAAACTSCHVNNVYKGTPRECVACHRTLYDRTTSPPHAPAGFSTTCETCHRATDTSWRGATFNHASVFALVGDHASAACTTCHVNNVYKGTPRECVACHRAKYDATRNPNHVAAGFPTGCESCHRPTDTAWTQGRFTHRFPLSGPHNRPCAQCHTTPNNYQVFSCTACHQRSETDSDHRGVNGYRYDSLACYSCHPTGRD